VRLLGGICLGGQLIPKLIPNTAVLQRIATLPLTDLSSRRNRICCGYENRSIVDPQERRGHEKEGIEIAKVTEPGAVLGELSALLDQSHTADVRTLETSQFRVARAELLEEDPVILLYVAAILAQRLNLASEALIELKSQVQLHHIVGKSIGKAVKKMEELLSATGADLVYAPGI
jgi:CRP-like cAMP-binding protein